MLGDGGDVELIDGRLLLGASARASPPERCAAIRPASTGGVLNSRFSARRRSSSGMRREALQLLGVHDREVEPGLGAVVQEDRVHHFARRGGQAERDVRDAEHGLDVAECFSLISRMPSMVSTAPPM